MNHAESSAAGLQNELKKEKKLKEKAESLPSDFHKSLLIVTEALEKAKADFEKEKASLTKKSRRC